MSLQRVASLCAGLGCVFLVALTPGVSAAQQCDCDNTGDSVCSAQGFRITLVNFAVNENAGMSYWDYQVCNEKGQGTGCEPPKDLSHINIDLPGLADCLSDDQMVNLLQRDNFANVSLSCEVNFKDPSCDITGTQGTDFVAKCNVASPSNLDPGECVTMRLVIAGETPTLGAGGVSTVTKAGPTCASDCIRGPSCTPCAGGGTGDSCLTRTIGFWGTHPRITNLFLPVTVCGKSLSNVAAGTCDSVTEALCVAPGVESKANPSYAQLVRQLAAAKLNFAASAANGGACDAAVATRIAQCEALCGASKKAIGDSGCVEDLSLFNESADTLPITPPPFDSPGAAAPAECQKANGNGVLIGKGPCS